MGARDELRHLDHQNCGPVGGRPPAFSIVMRLTPSTALKAVRQSSVNSQIDSIFVRKLRLAI